MEYTMMKAIKYLRSINEWPVDKGAENTDLKRKKIPRYKYRPHIPIHVKLLVLLLQKSFGIKRSNKQARLGPMP